MCACVCMCVCVCEAVCVFVCVCVFGIHSPKFIMLAELLLESIVEQGGVDWCAAPSLPMRGTREYRLWP